MRVTEKQANLSKRRDNIKPFFLFAKICISHHESGSNAACLPVGRSITASLDKLRKLIKSM